MSNNPSRFRVIDGGSTPKRYRRKKGEAGILVCHVCEADTGVATALTIEATQGRMIRDGKPEGGSRGIYCAHCLMRGKETRLI